jgi:very-short-patch-repair endonuclease
MICQYCNKECKNSNSLRNHERCCPKNLNRIYKNGMTGKKGSNQYAKGSVMSKETKIKISESSKGKIISEETKRKLSISRSEYMKNHPEKYRRKKSYMEKSFSDWLDSIFITYETEKHFRDTNINKSYFVDFLFEDKKLIIELDGNQHLKRKEWDEIRDKFLTSIGYRVVRITHKEYMEKTHIEFIRQLLNH